MKVKKYVLSYYSYAQGEIEPIGIYPTYELMTEAVGIKCRERIKEVVKEEDIDSRTHTINVSFRVNLVEEEVYER